MIEQRLLSIVQIQEILISYRVTACQWKN